MAEITVISRRLIDDRGRLCDRSFHKSTSGLEWTPACAYADTYRLELSRACLFKHRATIVAIAIVLAVAVILVVKDVNDPDEPVALVVGSSLLALCSIWGLVVMRWVATGRGQIIKRLEALPMSCVSCIYDLNDIPADPDGCVVCPECGAAWRREPASPSPS